MLMKHAQKKTIFAIFILTKYAINSTTLNKINYNIILNIG